MLDSVKQRLRKQLEPYVVKWTSEFLFSHENAFRFQAIADSAEYARIHMGDAATFADKKGVFREALTAAPRSGLFAEFGVWRGTTINEIAKYVGENTLVHGFDSFEGLPEDWFGRYTKGTFHMKGTLPAVRPNVRLHKGWFDATVPDLPQRTVTDQLPFCT